MANDSATGGYLSPAAAPPSDIAIEDFIQAYLVGLSGLPGGMVRPRFQTGNPKQPEPSVNWCAVAISRTTPDAGPALVHQVDADPEDGNGQDVMLRHSAVELLLSFYGPDAYLYAELTQDNASIPQNCERLSTFRMAFSSTGDIIAAPDLVNQQWVRRYDMRMDLRRQTQRTYPVLNLATASFVMGNEKF